MGALSNLMVLAIETNNRNSKDTSATLLAQMVIEQIALSTRISPGRYL